MADVNSFSFTGRLGADAVVKKTPNGKSYMEMSVAVGTGYGDFKKTVWIKVKQWGERVNNIVGIFTKGALVGGSGELSLNEWQSNKDGSNHTDIVVTCMGVQILSSKKETAKEPEPEQDVDQGEAIF